MTHAAQLIHAIRLLQRVRRRSAGLTYGELEALKISTCPWKRLEESGWRHLLPGERLERKTGCDGLVRFVIVK